MLSKIFNMQLAPVVLFVYNRPTHTRRAVESLLNNNLAKDSILIIYADGPRNENVKQSVSAVRRYLKNITGFKGVHIIESESNLGLSRSIVKGVTETVNKYGKVIVLEDDLVVAPNFLNFMNAGLEKYQNENRIMQISGYMYDVNLKTNDDAIILPFVTGWGWATWGRAWSLFNYDPSWYNKLKQNKQLRRKFNLDNNYDYFGLLSSQVTGKFDTWGILWYLSVFIKNGLAIHPTKTFVFNDGFDGSGTNCGPEEKPMGEVIFRNDKLVFKFPDNIVVNQFENIIYQEMNKELNSGIVKRIITKLKLFLK